MSKASNERAALLFVLAGWGAIIYATGQWSTTAMWLLVGALCLLNAHNAIRRSDGTYWRPISSVPRELSNEPFLVVNSAGFITVANMVDAVGIAYHQTAEGVDRRCSECVGWRPLEPGWEKLP